MPIVFAVMAGGTLLELSTGHCGTCGYFWHRSYRAGGCSRRHVKGEISIIHKRCEHWKLKTIYASEVEKEINKDSPMTLKRVIIRNKWNKLNADDPGYAYTTCILDLPDDSPFKVGSEIVGVEDV